MVGYRREAVRNLDKKNYLKLKSFTKSAKQKLGEGNFEGCLARGENIREELKDETSGTLMAEKTVAVKAASYSWCSRKLGHGKIK